MKAFLLISAGLIASCGNGFCQCPQPGLKVESAACESPKNLKINSITCSELKVEWLGNKNQTYLINATFIDPASNSLQTAKIAQNSCDNHGIRSATIIVKEDSKVTWSVQAVCLVQNATVHSFEVKGEDADILRCEQTVQGAPVKTMNVYPNPTSGSLSIEFYSEMVGIVEFRVFDSKGGKVSNKPGNAVMIGYNHYELDLRRLPAGTYWLEAASGNGADRVQFVIMRK